MKPISYNKWGQWVLTKNWTDDDHDNAIDWVDSGDRKFLDRLPEAKGKTRSNMMTALHNDISILQERGHEHDKDAIKNIDGVKHFKLYRLAEENNDFHNDNITSWTANKDFAHHWHRTVDEDEFHHANGYPKQLIHAYVPEHEIHSYLQPIKGHGKKEHEVLVKPHAFNVSKIEKGGELESNTKEATARNKASKFGL